MGDEVAHALAHDRVVDITTIGRKTGRARRIEIWMYEIGSSLYISGWPDLPRGWYANLLSHPEFTLHLKQTTTVDLPARARPITAPGERRAILEQIARLTGGALGDTEALIAGSPLIEVELRASLRLPSSWRAT